MGGARTRRRRSRPDARRVAHANSSLLGTDQEPAAKPGVRKRHRQRLFRRDPVGGPPGTDTNAGLTRSRRGGRPLHGNARGADVGDRATSRTRAAETRGRAAQVPQGAHEGRRGLSTLRRAHKRGHRRRFRHELVPRLPTLTRHGSAKPGLVTIKKTPREASRRGRVVFLNWQGSWRRPIFPRGYPLSIFGAGELNFRVRDGNGCGLSAGVTRILVQ